MTEENLAITSRRKKLLYIGLFTFQILVVFWPMMGGELILQHRMNMSFTSLGLIETVLILSLIITNILFLREFTRKKWMYLVIGIFIISFFSSTIARAVPAVSNTPELFIKVNLVGLSTVFINLLYTFYVAVKDIFRIKHDMIYSLVGAANIFLLIGSLFAFVVAITGSVFPGMVVTAEQALLLDNQANELAFYTLAGMDLSTNDINPFIRKILVIESIFSHLFVVIIIGRLLSK